MTFQLHKEFVKNIENTSVESLIQKLSESKGTGKERPGNSNLLDSYDPSVLMSVLISVLTSVLMSV